MIQSIAGKGSTHLDDSLLSILDAHIVPDRPLHSAQADLTSSPQASPIDGKARGGLHP